MEMIFVWYWDDICLILRWYLSDTEMIFVWYGDDICLIRTWYLSETAAQWEQCNRRCLESRRCPAGSFCSCTMYNVSLKFVLLSETRRMWQNVCCTFSVNCPATVHSPHVHCPIHEVLHITCWDGRLSSRQSNHREDVRHGGSQSGWNSV